MMNMKHDDDTVFAHFSRIKHEDNHVVAGYIIESIHSLFTLLRSFHLQSSNFSLFENTQVRKIRIQKFTAFTHSFIHSFIHVLSLF